MILEETRTERAIQTVLRRSRKDWLIRLSVLQGDLKALYLEASQEIRQILSFYADATDQIIGFNMPALLKDVQRTIDGLGLERNRSIETGLTAAALAGVESYQGPLIIAGIGVDALAAAADTVRRKTVREAFEFTYPDGLNLSDRLFRLDLAARQKVESVIRTSVALGEGARVSAQKLIRQGTPLSRETLLKMGFNTSAKIGSDVFKLFTPNGQGNIVHNALRVMRTELTKANRQAFLSTGDQINAVVGHRWRLSASHPRPDICDRLATQDIDGLGPGGYRKGNYPFMPAHPEDLCFDTPIFSARQEGLN